MEVSVVIVNYNVKYFLELCLLSVQKALQHTTGEIIVVDNLSIDDSCAMVKSKFPNVTLIENQTNVGFSKANNQGVAVAKGKYVLILNPDTVVGEHIFKEIVPFANSFPNLGALGIRLIDGSGMFLPESKRGLPTAKASFYKMMGSNKGGYYANYLTKDGVGKVAVLVGAFMFVERVKYMKVGGFDEDYFMYGEDIDLSYKLSNAGYDNYYYGKTVAIHYKGESTRKDVKYLKHFHGAMNIFYKKHFKYTFVDFLFMRVGVKLWFLTKYFQMYNAPILIEDTSRILFVGNRKIQEEIMLAKDIIQIKPSELVNINDYIYQNGVEEIWFEESSLSFQCIINQMATHRFKKVLYKILPGNNDFLIGSNSADGRGEIIDLK